VAAPGASARDLLLGAAVEYVLANGVSGLTLRALAKPVGTSHRMLLYHYGSRGTPGGGHPGRRSQSARVFTQLAAVNPNLARGHGIRQLWRHSTDPSLGPHERLFFEISRSSSYADASARTKSNRPGRQGSTRVARPKAGPRALAAPLVSARKGAQAALHRAVRKGPAGQAAQVTSQSAVRGQALRTRTAARG